MGQITRIGMDTSKTFFQLHGVDASEQVVLRRKVRRSQVLGFFEKLEAVVVGIEACGASHYWARELERRGHKVLLLPAQHVKAYVKRNKNDAADAAALCEAMTKQTMSFVAIKTPDQQAALMLDGIRERLLARRTQVANMIRGHAMEFGIVADKGIDKIEPLLLKLQDDTTLPALARELFVTLTEEFATVCRRVDEVEKKLLAWHKGNACSQRLAKTPGVGPVGASLMAMKSVDPERFKSSRHFAAWIGLTPKDHSTAGKQRLGRITRAGDERLRNVLISGAMSVILHAKRKPDRASPWLKAMLKRKPDMLVAVALANKNARICWKLMTTGETYNPNRCHAAPDAMMAA